MYLKIMKEVYNEKTGRTEEIDFKLIGKLKQIEQMPIVEVVKDETENYHQLSYIADNFISVFRKYPKKDTYDILPIASNLFRIIYDDHREDYVYTNCQCYVLNENGKTIQAIDSVYKVS